MVGSLVVMLLRSASVLRAVLYFQNVFVSVFQYVTLLFSYISTASILSCHRSGLCIMLRHRIVLLLITGITARILQGGQGDTGDLQEQPTVVQD